MTFKPDEVSTILNTKEKLRGLVKDKLLDQPWYDNAYSTYMFLSGGAIASVLLGEEPNDLDIYFTEDVKAEAFTSIIKATYIEDVKDVDEKYSTEVLIKGKLVTPRAVTMKSGAQLITKVSGSMIDVPKTFDFLHCTPVYDFHTNILYISPGAYKSIKNKQLAANNKSVITASRITKFLGRGWSRGTI